MRTYASPQVRTFPAFSHVPWIRMTEGMAGLIVVNNNLVDSAGDPIVDSTGDQIVVTEIS